MNFKLCIFKNASVNFSNWNFKDWIIPTFLPYLMDEVLLVTGLGLMAGVPMKERIVGVVGSDRSISFGRFSLSSFLSLRSFIDFNLVGLRKFCKKKKFFETQHFTLDTLLLHLWSLYRSVCTFSKWTKIREKATFCWYHLLNIGKVAT